VAPHTPSRIGLVVHPTRVIDEPLDAIKRWAGAKRIDLVQVPAPCEQREVAARGDAAECDLIVSIGGDGTTLAALRSASQAGRPALGVACGSLGVLTSVTTDNLIDALERFSAGDWRPRMLPVLAIERREERDPSFALNDVVVVRAGEGQVFVTARIDGVLAGRFAGDGAIVSTAIGSSGYALAAGGPLLTLEEGAFLFTPLSAHGGSCPPIVLGPNSELQLEVRVRHGGARLEVDGQIVGRHEGAIAVRLRAGVATVVMVADQEPFIAGLRRRQIITDSPRILAEDAAG
jgi:NAD+ kinase